MKNVLKYAAIAALCLSAVSLTGCKHEEYDTDQYAGAVALSAVAPNPVMRGGELRILGTNLENVSEVRFAGGVTVTDFNVTKSGAHGELRVMVPLEGPVVGKVSIVTKDGTVLDSFADLEFTEPIELDSFAPAEVLSGDVVTVKGEYLNNVQEVILGGVYITEFVSKDRHELKFVVPCDAVTGFVIVGDVNEIADPNTIPNQIYSATELVVGDPTVNEAAKATYKSGDVITVTGAHLDMIQKVDLVGAADVDFNVAEDGKSLSFTLPASATDGAVTLTSFAGKAFSAGEIETVTVADLAIKSLAEDGRYKAGCEVEITGSDLDLVSKVDFVNAQASFYLDGDKIIATLPAAAKDGSVTVTLDSGKQAYTPEIEVVKPVATGVDKTEAVAGKDKVVVSGTDLDLVTGVTIGDKVQSFITCEFSVNSAEEVVVTIPAAAYDGVLTLTAESGYTSETEVIAISYNEEISVVYDAPSFEMGKVISFTGTGLLKVESVSLKGIKVLQYLVREDNAMAFNMPEGVGPGVYRLEFTLLDGTSLTWPVPFEITAPYTETFLFEGSQDLGSWSINWSLTPADAMVQAGAKAGDILRIYGTPTADWWQIQMFDGHWGGMDLGLGNGNNVNPNIYDLSEGYIAIELDADRAEKFTTLTDWGQYGILQGENFIVTGISLIQFGETEKVLFEGPVSLTWGDDGRFGLALSFFEKAAPDSKLIVYFHQTENWGQVQFNDGSWGNSGIVFPELGGPILNTDNVGGKDVEKIELTLTASILEVIRSNPGSYFGLNTEYQDDGRVGMIIQGSDWIIDKVTIQ